MDNHRFDALVRALQPANRRSLLGGALGGVLGLTALALGQDEGDAAKKHNRNNNNNRRNNRRRRRRRNRRRTWHLLASPLTSQPLSGGDRSATSACQAQIRIVQRRRRFQICGNFNYSTHAVQNRNINVRDVIIQPGNANRTTPAVVTFDGWTGSNVHDSGCKRIPRDLARDIRSSPDTYFVNIRTNNPNHPNGAVAGRLERE
jgi:hypothetical protein